MADEEVEENPEEEEIPDDVIPDVPPNSDMAPEEAQPEQEVQTRHVSISQTFIFSIFRWLTCCFQNTEFK